MTRDVIQHIRDEESDSYSDDSLFNIKSWGADLSFRELVQRYQDDELIKPELQRHYVWDRTEASRFIDSLLLGLPIPSIFLAETSDEKLLIIDGYQRIMTVHDYIRGIFSRDGKVFRLSRTERINQRWRGKAFNELGEVEQRRIKNTTIHAIMFVQQQPKSDDTSLFQIFERINTSGRMLLPQEIRNCVAQGKFNSLLFELNLVPSWRALFGLPEPDSRMRDLELILRFFALGSDTFRNDTREKISLKRFLDVYMLQNVNPEDQKLQSLRERFCLVMDYILNAFGPTAFHNISSASPDRLVPKFSPTLFDSVTIATDFALSQGKAQLRGGEDVRREMLRDPDYREATSKETMTRSNILRRVSLADQHLFGLQYE